jgi:DNA-directed RNA polymerase subunit L
MEIKIIEESKDRIVIDIEGEDATLCNSLRKELYNDDKVKNASYAVEHPAVGVPRMIIETSGKSPKDALVDAAKRLKKDIAAFKKAFEKEA